MQLGQQPDRRARRRPVPARRHRRHGCRVRIHVRHAGHSEPDPREQELPHRLGNSDRQAIRHAVAGRQSLDAHFTAGRDQRGRGDRQEPEPRQHGGQDGQGAGSHVEKRGRLPPKPQTKAAMLPAGDAQAGPPRRRPRQPPARRAPTKPSGRPERGQSARHAWQRSDNRLARQVVDAGRRTWEYRRVVRPNDTNVDRALHVTSRSRDPNLARLRPKPGRLRHRPSRHPSRPSLSRPRLQRAGGVPSDRAPPAARRHGSPDAGGRSPPGADLPPGAQPTRRRCAPARRHAAHQQLKGRPIGRVLTKMGKVTREQVVEALEFPEEKGRRAGPNSHRSRIHQGKSI